MNGINDAGKLINSRSYSKWLNELKVKVRLAQLKAAVFVNTALLEFYWGLGADIVEKQKTAKWGSGFLNRLSRDLMSEFPDMKGFSEPNLLFIKRWFLFYNEGNSNSVTACDRIKKIAVNPIFQIPWGHNRIIITKCETVDEAIFYVLETVKNNWSRSSDRKRTFSKTGKIVEQFQ